MAEAPAPMLLQNWFGGLNPPEQQAVIESFFLHAGEVMAANAPAPPPPFDPEAAFDHRAVQKFLKVLKDKVDYKGGVSGDPAIWLKKVELSLKIAECTDDTTKIVAISAILAGNAIGWFNYMKDQGSIPGTYDGFKALFIKTFQPVDPSQLAREKLYKLQQTASVQKYNDDFRGLVLQITPKMDNEEQKARYLAGLKNPVYDLVKALNPEEIATIEKLQTWAERKDNYYWQTTKGRSKHYAGGYGGELRYYTPTPQQYSQQALPRFTNNGAVPMDIDAIQAAPPQGYSKLTPALKLQLIKEGKCFYCRTGQHRAAECPLRKKKDQQHPNGNRQ